MKYLIAAHGTLAEGFRSSIRVIMGDDIANSIEVLNCFVEGGTENPSIEIEKFYNSLDKNEKGIILTDLMHGSVNQSVINQGLNPRVQVVTGINLPLIIELIAEHSFGTSINAVSEETFHKIIKDSKEQIFYVNHEMNTKSELEDDFF